MNKNDKSILIDTITRSDSQVILSAVDRLGKLYTDIITDYTNYIYAKGNNPICLVAHIDTLRKHDKVKLSVSGGRIRNLNGILGADDRAGVAAILIMLKRFSSDNLPSILFTTGEEVGGIGVSKFIASEEFDTTSVNLFVEIDRQGDEEYVFYSQMIPDAVAVYVESFGFKENWGCYSDVADLTKQYRIPHVNVSAGYYKQHTNNEYLIIDHLEKTIEKVLNMVNNPIMECHLVDEYNYSKYDSKYSWGYYKGSKGSKTDYYDKNYDYYTDYSDRYLDWPEYQPTKARYAFTLQEVLDTFTAYGCCANCGKPWYDCSCGDMYANLIDLLDIDELLRVESEMRSSTLQKDLFEYLYCVKA